MFGTKSWWSLSCVPAGRLHVAPGRLSGEVANENVPSPHTWWRVGFHKTVSTSPAKPDFFPLVRLGKAGSTPSSPQP